MYIPAIVLILAFFIAPNIAFAVGITYFLFTYWPVSLALFIIWLLILFYRLIDMSGCSIPMPLWLKHINLYIDKVYDWEHWPKVVAALLIIWFVFDIFLVFFL